MSRYTEFYNAYGMFIDARRPAFYRLPEGERHAILDEHHRRGEAIRTAYGTTGEALDYHDARFEPNATGSGDGVNPDKHGAAIQELWQDLLDKDDRTSPSEYPDMCLITHDEFADYLHAFMGDTAIQAATLRTELDKLRQESGRLADLLKLSQIELAGQLKSMLDSYRALFPTRQTDAEVLADDDHEEIDDPSYAEMNRWNALIKEIDAALTKEPTP